jgi:5-methyltetrahydrofolate--homocysteine methyltransferase
MRSVRPDSPPGPAEIPIFLESDPWVRKADDFLEMLVQLEIPLGTTLMRGLGDLLSALYGTPEFVYRLVDGGSQIREVIERLADLWIAFARFQLERIPLIHGGSGSFFYSMWLPGRGVWLQDDASALLSPGLFEEYIVPSIARIADAFDTVMMHLHPAGYIPVDALIRTNLAAIELHIDKGGPSARELLPWYRTIQAEKPLVIWGDLSREDLLFVRDHLDPRALAVMPVIRSVEEAGEIRALFGRA